MYQGRMIKILLRRVTTLENPFSPTSKLLHIHRKKVPKKIPGQKSRVSTTSVILLTMPPNKLDGITIVLSELGRQLS